MPPIKLPNGQSARSRELARRTAQSAKIDAFVKEQRPSWPGYLLTTRIADHHVIAECRINGSPGGELDVTHLVCSE